MDGLIGILYRTISGLRYIWFSLFSRDVFKINVNKRFLVNWNKKFLIKHNLHSTSIVFEVWWYTGVFTDMIIALYDPYMYIFEPVREYYDILCKKYTHNKKIKIFWFWLSDKNETISIGKSHDWSSIFKQWAEKEKILLQDIYDFLTKEELIHKKIDLISINIEWGEYKLLGRILETTPDVFRNIQVQFHDFVENASLQRNFILDTLYRNGYTRGYSFPFVRELFKK